MNADPRPPATATWPRPLLVLMYHGIHRDAADRGHFDPRYSVAPDAFDAQMALLAERRESLWLPDGPAPRSQRAPTVMISFDDGDLSDVAHALPCLVRQRLRAVFFVTSQNLGGNGWISAQQLRQLAEAGMHVGSHGASHRFLSSLTDAQLREELLASRDALEQAGGRRVDWLALPGGRGSAEVSRTAHALGYQRVFGSVPGINSGSDPSIDVQRVAITRDTTLADFAEILAWRGRSVTALRWRHRLLQLPRALLGDLRYDSLRKALLR